MRQLNIPIIIGVLAITACLVRILMLPDAAWETVVCMLVIACLVLTKIDKDHLVTLAAAKTESQEFSSLREWLDTLAKDVVRLSDSQSQGKDELARVIDEAKKIVSQAQLATGMKPRMR